MTSGWEALREAARLETARVYGQLCPEHREHYADEERSDQTGTLHDIEAARLRKGVA